jgi:aspartate--ammonia ligase
MKDSKTGVRLPIGYVSKLNLIETEIAIKAIKDFFQKELSRELNLSRVSAPLFVLEETGLNDNLNGVERPVKFDVSHIKKDVEIVHSLAKWKRMALHRYKFGMGEGLYTDMNAIRRDEILDHLHSVYVDQWDWEKIMSKEDRTEKFLKDIVTKIYSVFKRTGEFVEGHYPSIGCFLPDDIFFITTQELEDMYPDKTPKEREDLITEKHGAVFIMKIGGVLKSGERHDGRAPDYDDWELNGDIIFWNPVIKSAFELSSMGIRVDGKALEKQLKIAGCEDRKEKEFHKMLLEGKLPYTVGGGIGQSRICMFFLQKAHIGEVQASVWPKEMVEECMENGIELL